uniref:SoHo domain-containing protein n=1 Tax=Junco hyemalis TaxID=40217 RepID=A0A8C5IPP3_JUNHY
MGRPRSRAGGGSAPRGGPGHTGTQRRPGRSRCLPTLPGDVPVIRHRGSNTLNFHFHEPESRGTAQNSPGAPKSSGTESPEHPGDTWGHPPGRPSPSPRAAPACPRPPGWSATWTKDSKRRERRWVKYDGIGPVDETGMPLASRSSVDSPRDWYRSMFRQIHSKLPGEPGCAGGHGAGTERARPGPRSPPHPQSPTGTPIPAPPRRLHPGSVHRGEELGVAAGPGARGQCQPGRHSPELPVQVLLEQELEQLSEELDKDMRDMETRRAPRQVPPGPPAAPWAPQGIQVWAHPGVGTFNGGHIQL